MKMSRETTSQWCKTVAFNIGPWEMAKNLGKFSTQDWSCAPEGDNCICTEG